MEAAEAAEAAEAGDGEVVEARRAVLGLLLFLPHW
jgi:hypothetical protein